MSPAPRTGKAQRNSRAVGHRTRVGMERRARTRARIVAAALRVFAAKGADSPVIDDFIREAGVARGTFYNYFTRTEQLLVAVSRSLEDDLILSIEAELRGLDDPVARLATGLRLWLGWARADRVWCAFIVNSRFRGALVEQILQTDLRDGRRAGALRFPSIEVARDLVVGTALEAMSRMLQAPRSRAYCDAVVGTVLAGLGVEPARIAQLLAAPLPKIRRPVAQIVATEPSSPQ